MPMETLTYHRILQNPHPIFMGPLPMRYQDIPARVVINMCGDYPDGDGQGYNVFSMPLFDVQDTKFLPARERLEGFLDEVHDAAGQQASYWHCHAGINRSGLALAAYLHRFHDYRISESIALLRSQRSPVVLCNTLFERTLREWYGGPDEQAFTPFSIEAYLAGRTGSTLE